MLFSEIDLWNLNAYNLDVFYQIYPEVGDEPRNAYVIE